MQASVIIPVRNGEAYIAQTLRSALNQTRPPAEIIVVDNGSTDGSLAIAEGFGGIVRAVSVPEGGANAARLAGEALARGEALMFLDADDLLGPTALEELAAVLERRPGVIACCPWYRFELKQGCWLTAPASCAPRGPDQDHLSAWLAGWYHPPCSVLWSREAYRRSGGWDPEIRVNQDGDLMMRAFVAGVDLVPTAGGAAYYRRLPGEAVSVSGRRLTPEGLASRLHVLDKICGALEAAGTLDAYRADLARAYRQTGGDCGAVSPDLHRSALAAADALAAQGPASRRKAKPFAPLPAVAVHSPAPDRARPDPEPPLISVVIPTFNRAHCLPRTIHTVLAQTHQRFEILVVDDSSTDGTAEVVAGIGDPRVRYLPQPRNGGVAAARNRGLREARGALIAFLDSDDEWSPEKLRLQVELLARRPDKVGLVFTGVEELRGSGERVVEIPEHRGDVYGEMLLRNVIHGGGSNAMIRREVVDVVGYFDESLPAIEDFDYWTRICRFYEVDFVPESLFIYHNQDDADPAVLRERRSRNFAGNMAARRLYFERYRHEMRRAGVEHLFLLDSAHRTMASPFGGRLAAARLILQALRARPREIRLYAWLVLALAPGRVRVGLQHRVRALRARLTARRKAPAHA